MCAKAGRLLNIRIGDDSDEDSFTHPPMQGYGAKGAPKGNQGKPFLGIHFVDCHVYGRIYRNDSGSHYEGVCPKCRRAIKIRIGPSGSETRTFKAYCD